VKEFSYVLITFVVATVIFQAYHCWVCQLKCMCLGHSTRWSCVQRHLSASPWCWSTCQCSTSCRSHHPMR